MKNILTVTVDELDNLSDIIELYEEEGLTFIRKEANKDKTVSLTFEGDREDVSYNTQIEGQKGFIEFEDGTQSPLYIRRERNFWED